MSAERTVLLAPAAVARAAAVAVSAPEQRWMLSQPRAVRRSFVVEVLDHADDPHAEQRWMLLQDDAVRGSYVDRVRPPAEQAWMLRQSRAVRESYVREVLDAL